MPNYLFDYRDAVSKLMGLVGNQNYLRVADKNNPLGEGLSPFGFTEGGRGYSGSGRTSIQNAENTAKAMLKGAQGNYENAMKMAHGRMMPEVVDALKALQAKGFQPKLPSAEAEARAARMSQRAFDKEQADLAKEDPISGLLNTTGTLGINSLLTRRR